MLCTMYQIKTACGCKKGAAKQNRLSTITELHLI